MTQTMKNDIKQCEKQYITCFSTMTQKDGIWYFEDPMIKDMYYHNFMYITRTCTKEQTEKLISSHLNELGGKGFCKVFFEEDYPVSIIQQIADSMICKMEMEVLGKYLLDCSQIEKWQQREDCNIKIQFTSEETEKTVEMDTALDGETFGADFCRRRAERMGRTYIAHPNLYNHLIYHNEQLVGSCALFVNGQTAKVEDFSVRPECQRKGFGTTLLKQVVTKALSLGVKQIYLDTDEEDTAKEMYQKLGFSKIGENAGLLWADWM